MPETSRHARRWALAVATLAAQVAACAPRDGLDDPVLADGEIVAAATVPVRGGQVQYDEIYVPEGSDYMILVLDWGHAQEHRFRFQLRTSDGALLPWDDPAVRGPHFGDRHMLANVHLGELLAREPAKVGPQAWLAEITSDVLTPDQTENVRLSVGYREGGGTPELETGLSADRVEPGKPVLVRARARQRSWTVTLTDVHARITFPAAAQRPPMELPMTLRDGYYTVELTDTAVVGPYAIRVDVATTLGRHHFAVARTLDLMVAP